MKIVLVGGSGTIGRQLGAALSANNADVCLVSLGRNNVDGHHSPMPSLKDKNAWEKLLADADVLINLVASTKVDKNNYENSRCINVDMAATLFNYASEFTVSKYIFMSSIGVCAGHNSPFTIRENTSYKPNNLYAETKVEAEQVLLKLAEKSETQLSIVRPPMVYSADTKGPLKLIMKFIYKGLFLPLADVHNKRYHISIGNLCSFIDKIIYYRFEGSQIFVVSDQKPVSSEELIKLLSRGMGKDPRLFYIPKSLLKAVFTLLGKGNLTDSLLNDLTLDTQRTRSLTNWEPKENVECELVKVGKAYKEIVDD